MLRQIAASVQGGRNTVLSLHPMEISRLMEETWALLPPTPPIVGLEVPAALVDQESRSGVAGDREGLAGRILWDHLIYAYMIENTRVYEIFRRVIEEYTYGERLEVPSAAGQQWLRTTEALFYRDAPPYQIGALTSSVRPDARGIRRNAYFRMFGMDLLHGTDDNRPYPYVRPTAVNSDFVATLEELLHEVHLGITHFANLVGARPTDPAAIATLASRLQDMLLTRRRNGNLSREELVHVSMMAWFDLTLMGPDAPIVIDLKAEASSADERLMKIGQRVGLAAHTRSAAYLRLAPSLSLLLRAIEAGTFSTPATSPLLYLPGRAQLTMSEIIRDWSITTGRDMKAGKVIVTGPSPVPAVQPPVSANGRGARPLQPTGR